MHLVNKQLLSASHGHRGRREKIDFLALEPPVFQGEGVITTGETYSPFSVVWQVLRCGNSQKRGKESSWRR